LVGLVGALLMAPQTTEFWSKVGLLAGLTLVCASRPILYRVLPEPGSVEDDPRRYWTRCRAGAAALGVAAVAAGIVLAGAPARGASQVNAEEALLEPARMDAATFPSISVDSAVTEWDPTLSGAAMQAIVLTAAQNLDIENQALLAADPDLLTQVDHGDRLDEMQGRIRDATTTGTTRIERYRPESIDVSLLRPFGRQDGLSLGLQTRGEVTSETYDAAGRLQTRETAPFARTFVVRRATGARWLNVAVLPADGGATSDPQP
ncbi:MAG: hypothetical protein JO057_01510, partial [Chloroflexi bacterium]|nr:hypothetical protein [Chloroflexota bacterium]